MHINIFAVFGCVKSGCRHSVLCTPSQPNDCCKFIEINFHIHEYVYVGSSSCCVVCSCHYFFFYYFIFFFYFLISLLFWLVKSVLVSKAIYEYILQVLGHGVCAPMSFTGGCVENSNQQKQRQSFFRVALLWHWKFLCLQASAAAFKPHSIRMNLNLRETCALCHRGWASIWLLLVLHVIRISSDEWMLYT